VFGPQAETSCRFCNLQNCNDPDRDIFIDAFGRFSAKWLKWYAEMTSGGAYTNGMCRFILI